jgi:hydrogenase maturation protease
MHDAVVIAVGRRDRGDDGAGPALLDRLAELGAMADLLHLRPDPGDLHSALAGRRVAILVDACRSGERPGSLRDYDLTMASPPAARRASHGMPLLDAVDLVRGLYGLPPTCRLLAVEAAGFDHGSGLSPDVADAVDTLAERVIRQIGRGATPPPSGQATRATRAVSSGSVSGAQPPPGT